MTPQAKAFHLMFEIQRDIVADDKKAKEIALKLVKHIISSNPHSNPLNSEVNSTMNYWLEVKQEIEKL